MWKHPWIKQNQNLRRLLPGLTRLMRKLTKKWYLMIDLSKQSRPRSKVIVWSGSTLFAFPSFIIHVDCFSLPDLVDRMSDVKTSLDKTESDSAEIAARADQINEKVDKEMIPKIRELQKIHSGDFEDIHVSSELWHTVFLFDQNVWKEWIKASIISRNSTEISW